MKEIKFLKKGIRIEGQYFPVWYSMGNLGPNYPQETISIYSKNYGHFPADAFDKVENDTEIMTDYFEKDRVRLLPGDRCYAAALKAVAAQR